jgi:hypothetical protein
MLKNNLTIGVFLLLLLLGTSFAQSSGKIGIGVAIIDFETLFQLAMSEGAGGTASITIPYLMSPTFRLEPEFGYTSATQKLDGIAGYNWEASVSTMNIGVGIFPSKIFDAFTLYYGGRVGYLTQKQTEEETGVDDAEATSSGFYLAPAIGGEYNFSDHFSLGAEAQFVYASMTNEEQGQDYKLKLTLLNTRALVFFRFYF